MKTRALFSGAFLFLIILFGVWRFSGQTEEVSPVSGSPRSSSAGSLAAVSVSLGASEKPAPVFHRIRSGDPDLLPHAAAIIFDAQTGDVYFSDHADMRWPLASLTKLVTASRIQNLVASHTIVTIGTDVFSALGDDALDVVKPGEQYDASLLLRAMLVASSNESAEALADQAGRDGVLSAMNGYAASLGLSSTHFSDPTGIAAANQSTVAEFATIVRDLYATAPSLFQMTRSPSVTIVPEGSKVKKTLKSTHELVGRSDFLGGKTGYTDEAKGNLLTLFAYETRPMGIIVFGTDDRFGVTKNAIDWFKTHYTSKE
jgi:D-alanyl-D-alanine carboxypeptidase